MVVSSRGRPCSPKPCRPLPPPSSLLTHKQLPQLPLSTISWLGIPCEVSFPSFFCPSPHLLSFQQVAYIGPELGEGGGWASCPQLPLYAPHPPPVPACPPPPSSAFSLPLSLAQEAVVVMRGWAQKGRERCREPAPSLEKQRCGLGKAPFPLPVSRGPNQHCLHRPSEGGQGQLLGLIWANLWLKDCLLPPRQAGLLEHPGVGHSGDPTQRPCPQTQRARPHSQH